MGLARVERLNLGLSAGAVAASYALSTPHFATSLAAGAALEAINLGAIHRGAKRLFAGQMLTNGWVGVLAMRLLVLSFAIFMVMRMGAHPIALLIGLSITMPATIIDAWMNRPPIIDPAELPTFLEDFEEEDAERFDHEDRIGEPMWSTGHLMTSRSLDLEDRLFREAANLREASNPEQNTTDESLFDESSFAASPSEDVPRENPDERTR